MNHWHTIGQLGAGHRADMERDAAGGVRMRAAGCAEERSTDSGPTTILLRALREGQRRLNDLRLVLTGLVAHGRRLPRLAVPRARETIGVNGPWRYRDAESTER